MWRGSRSREQGATLVAALLALALAILLLGGEPASALPREEGPTVYASRAKAQTPKKEVAGPPAPPKGKGKSKNPLHTPSLQEEEKKGGAKATPVSPVAGTGTAMKELGDEGQVDPIIGLGLRNPMCDHLSEIRDIRTRLACKEFGTPESVYPASNYGFDIFIDTGIDAPEGIAMKGIVRILDGIWLAVTFILKLILDLLGLAFGLNPFGNGETMRRVTGAVRLIYSGITSPWLSTMVVMGGIWFAYKGLVKREVGATVAGTLASIAMVVFGLWVVHEPSQSVGRLANMSNQVAIGVISAPHSGSLSRPNGAFAEEMSQTWERLVEVPFAGLNFSDVKWAMGPPPEEAVEKAEEKFCDDVGTRALLESSLHGGTDDEEQACRDFAREHYGKPARVVDLYLRSSPNSPAREALWQYFDKDEGDLYKSKVAAQGGDGVLTRLSMLALFVLALLGAVLLLAWLAIRLFTQAAIGFVLLLAAPFALFFPMLGDAGRRAFRTWGLTLLGAIVAKIIYAAFLSIVLLGFSILGRVGGSGGFLLATAFAWAVFLKRVELVGWLSIGELEVSQPLAFHRQLMALEMGRRMLRNVTGPIRGGAGGRGGGGPQPASRAEDPRATSMKRLRSSSLGISTRDPAPAAAGASASAAPGHGGGDAGRPGPQASLGPHAHAEAAGTSARAPRDPERAEWDEEGAGERHRNPGEYVEEAARGRERPDGEREGDLFDVRRREGDESRPGGQDPAHPIRREDGRPSELKKGGAPERARVEESVEKGRGREAERLEVGSQVPGRVREWGHAQQLHGNGSEHQGAGAQGPRKQGAGAMARADRPQGQRKQGPQGSGGTQPPPPQPGSGFGARRRHLMTKLPRRQREPGTDNRKNVVRGA
jgi:hypothetical protein